MPLCFRYNDTTYELPTFTSNVAPVCLYVIKNGTTYYVPTDIGLSSIIVDNYKYFYNSSKPTIHIVSGGGSLCNCFNDSEQAITYDFPAGTYVGQYAYDSIGSAIRGNSYRTLKYDVTITHQGTTRTWPAGTRMYKTYAYSGNCINYVFIKSAIKPNTVGQCDLMGDNYHTWYANTGGTGYYNDDYATIQLKINFGGSAGRWSTIPFTVTPGIKFT